MPLIDYSAGSESTMTILTICSREFSPSMKSPFNQILCLGFYDGPTSGFARCAKASLAYYFETVAWDAEQENRVYSLAEMHNDVFDSATEALSHIEQPRWPVWLPNMQSLPDHEQKAIRSRIEVLLEGVPEPAYVAAADSIEKEILALRLVEPNARVRLPSRWSLPTEEHWSFWQQYLRTR